MPVTVDAKRLYRPERIPVLIEEAQHHVGEYRLLAQRLGVSDRYLLMLRNGQRTASYGLQVMLEVIIEQGAGAYDP